jgi:hypothetical protein
MPLLGGVVREVHGGAVDDRVDVSHGRVQRAVVEKIALHKLHVVLAQPGRAIRIAHERADPVASECKALR